jgi:hypothetical protein
VIEISAGMDHALALKSDGTVVAWGDSFMGGTSVPAGLSKVISVSAGQWFSMALTWDSSQYSEVIVAWGNDMYGQTDVPADLATAPGYAARIAAGGEFALAVAIWHVPDAPTDVVAKAGNGFASVSWKALLDNRECPFVQDRRPDQRDHLHVHCHGHQRHRDRSRLNAIGSSDACRAIAQSAVG